MPEPSMVYWVYFDKVGRPEKIVARDLPELWAILERSIRRIGEMPEWIIRGYK